MLLCCMCILILNIVSTHLYDAYTNTTCTKIYQCWPLRVASSAPAQVRRAWWWCHCYSISFVHNISMEFFCVCVVWVCVCFYWPSARKKKQKKKKIKKQSKVFFFFNIASELALFFLNLQRNSPQERKKQRVHNPNSCGRRCAQNTKQRNTWNYTQWPINQEHAFMIGTPTWCEWTFKKIVISRWYLYH